MKDLGYIFQTFRFESWWFLGLLLLVPLWAWLRGRVAPTAAVAFSTAGLLREAARQTRFKSGQVLLALRYLALILLIVALARPQVEKGVSDAETKGINIMMVLDFSSSMTKKDFMMDSKRVTRFQALIRVISEFMRARPNDRIGIVRFDKEAFLTSPLTLDHDYLIQRLQQEKNSHGTAPGSGMLIATEHLLLATNQTKVMILVSDADQVSDGENPVDVAKAVARLGVRMHLIQIVDFKDMGPVRWGTEMADATKATGGQHFQVADFNGLRNVYQMIDQLEKATFKEGKQKNWRELMAWCAAPGLGLLLLELMLRQTVWRRLP